MSDNLAPRQMPTRRCKRKREEIEVDEGHPKKPEATSNNYSHDSDLGRRQKITIRPREQPQRTSRKQIIHQEITDTDADDYVKIDLSTRNVLLSRCPITVFIATFSSTFLPFYKFVKVLTSCVMRERTIRVRKLFCFFLFFGFLNFINKTERGLKKVFLKLKN